MLCNKTAAQVGGAERFIQIRHIRNCFKADPEYGQGVAKTRGLSMSEVNNFDMTPYNIINEYQNQPTDRFSKFFKTKQKATL